MTSSINYLAEIEQLRAQLAEKEAQLQSQSARIDVLEEVVRHLKIKRFMPSSEKTNADQFLLFDEAELCTDPQVEQHEKDNQDQNKSNASTRKPRGRKPLSSDLPREQIFLYLTDEQKVG
ncbi:transposase, partial [Vibrio metschnikovii]